MLDKMLIQYCSPTLSSLKIANMFNYTYSSDDKLNSVIDKWNRILNPKGVYLYILRRRAKRALIYVYRDSMLAAALRSPGIQGLLEKFGYQEFSKVSCIKNLHRRFMNSTDFPHEIGVFLGYPLDDVIGYIENRGRNCKCTGCWQVYSNEFEAVKLFMKYKKCRDVYTRLFEKRIKSVSQLTVSRVAN